jgi:hypothetical protein
MAISATVIRAPQVGVFTTPGSFPNGSAAAPSVTGVAADTGMYFTSTTVLFSFAGSNRVTMGNSFITVNGSGAAGSCCFGAGSGGTGLWGPSSGTDLGVAVGSTERARFDSLGNVSIGTAAIATTATDGFLYITSCAGPPTGVPTAKTGRWPLVIDSTNHKLYFYDGAWRDAGP